MIRDLQQKKDNDKRFIRERENDKRSLFFQAIQSSLTWTQEASCATWEDDTCSILIFK